MRCLAWIASLCTLILLCAPTLGADEPLGKEVWLFWQSNLANDKMVEELEGLIARAAPLGFTHVLLSDTRSNRLGYLKGIEPQTYPKNVQRIKDVAAKYNIKIVPACFDVGYSNASLSNDPNLAEGLPVKEAPFLVKAGQADIAAAPIPLDPAKPDMLDPTCSLQDRVITIGEHEGNARFGYRLKLPKYRYYHISLQIKTQDYVGSRPDVKPIASVGERQLVLQYFRFVPEKNQDWKQYDLVFNTLDNPEITLYFGLWNNSKGTMQIKDWKIEEAGLVNLLRRDGCPFEVKLVQDGQTVPLKEGEDYEPVADPHLGNQGMNGRYTIWHEAPRIAIKNKAKIPDGSKLLVSWYHPMITTTDQVTICMSEPKTNALLAETAQRLRQLWGADYYFMEHDEFRSGNHCQACLKRHMTTGQMLAENVAYCTKLLDGQTRFVWSDMFDPNHNAVDNYWLAGDMRGSWEGLSKEVVPMVWYYQKREASMKFFTDRGHELMCSIHYDNDNPQAIRDWVQSARKFKGVRGFMYTTWAHDYKNLESFAKTLKEAKGQ